MNQKKRHHYLPETYLKAFCDDTGRVHAYRKDDPSTPFVTSPNGTGLRRYYYSQPTPDGGVDNNRLEDAFQETERHWSFIVERMQRREDVNDSLATIFEFTALQRIRVPASRDATEAALATSVKQTMMDLYTEGALPPMPPEIGSIDDILVSIDPHASIHGMVNDLEQSVRYVFEHIGLCAIHNSTGLPFLTSDNPVIWFDPSVADQDQIPYKVSNGGPIMFFFPVSPTLILMGSDDKEKFNKHGLLYGDAPDENWVLRINEAICRYGYEAIYSQGPGPKDLIQRYASLSPIYDPQIGMVFGTRSKLPKWNPTKGP